MPSRAHHLGLGRIGEQIAVRHLERAGLTVVERNWRCSTPALRGEVDIVAAEGATLVLCEVKTRRRAGVEDVLEAVTVRKQHQLRRLAGAYAAQMPWHPEELRIDVIGVWWPSAGGAAEVVHLRAVC